MAEQRDVYIAIMVAAAQGKGLHLSWDECADLANDDAVATRAANSLSEAEFKGKGGVHYLGDGWKAVDPRKARKAYNGRMRDMHGRLP